VSDPVALSVSIPVPTPDVESGGAVVEVDVPPVDEGLVSVSSPVSDAAVDSPTVIANVPDPPRPVSPPPAHPDVTIAIVAIHRCSTPNVTAEPQPPGGYTHLMIRWSCLAFSAALGCAGMHYDPNDGERLPEDEDASNSADESGETDVVYTPCPMPDEITPATLPDGQVGSPYDVELYAQGAGPGWSFVGALPPGLALEWEEGTDSAHILGVPTHAGAFEFEIEVLNLNFDCDEGDALDQPYAIVIADPIACGIGSACSEEGSCCGYTDKDFAGSWGLMCVDGVFAPTCPDSTPEPGTPCTCDGRCTYREPCGKSSWTEFECTDGLWRDACDEGG
jgi:hypothetical protein